MYFRSMIRITFVVFAGSLFLPHADALAQWSAGAAVQYRAANPDKGLEVRAAYMRNFPVEDIMFFTEIRGGFFFYQEKDVTPRGIMDVGYDEHTRSYGFSVTPGLQLDLGVFQPYAAAGVGYERVYGRFISHSPFTGVSERDIDSGAVYIAPSAGFKIKTGWKPVPYLDYRQPVYLNKNLHTKNSGTFSLGISIPL